MCLDNRMSAAERWRRFAGVANRRTGCRITEVLERAMYLLNKRSTRLMKHNKDELEGVWWGSDM